MTTLVALPTTEQQRSDLPYNGDVQAAQRAGDRAAIRQIFNQRLVAEGQPEIVVPEIVVVAEEDEGTEEEDSYDNAAIEPSSASIACLMFGILLLFGVLWGLVMASVNENAHSHSDSHNRGNHYAHHSTRHAHHGDQPSWGYFVGFFVIVAGLITEAAAATFVGIAIICGFAAAEQAFTSSSSSSSVSSAAGASRPEYVWAVLLALLACFFLWFAYIAHRHQRQQREGQWGSGESEEQSAEERAAAALEQATKKVIYTAHHHHRDHVVAGDDATGGKQLSSCPAAGNGDVVLDIGMLQQQEEGAVHTQEYQEEEYQEEEEEEECAICLECFEDGEELTAAGCGHYFHTACFQQWAEADASHDAYASSGHMRCPVCRFEVESAAGAPTPARIAHMRPGAVRQRARYQVQCSDKCCAGECKAPIPTAVMLDADMEEMMEEIDLEAGSTQQEQEQAQEQAHGVRNPLWGRVRAALARSRRSSRGTRRASASASTAAVLAGSAPPEEVHTLTAVQVVEL